MNQAKLDRVIAEGGFGALESAALDAKNQVIGIKTAIDNIPETKTVTINVRYAVEADPTYGAADAGTLAGENVVTQPEDHDPVNDQSDIPPYDPSGGFNP